MLPDTLEARAEPPTLNHIRDAGALTLFVCEIKMDPSLSNTTPNRNILIELIKAQLDDESQDQDFRRDVFLCLAVTIPPRQRIRVRGALESLLARARIRSSCRDLDPGEDPQDLHGDFNIAAELARNIGVVSTLLVMGCESAAVVELFEFLLLCIFLGTSSG